MIDLKDKRNNISIIGICLTGFLIASFVDIYRGTWIYEYGHFISLMIFYSGVFLSLLYTIYQIKNNSLKKQINLIWIVIGTIPFLYIIYAN